MAESYAGTPSSTLTLGGHVLSQRSVSSQTSNSNREAEGLAAQLLSMSLVPFPGPATPGNTGVAFHLEAYARTEPTR